MKPNIQLHSGEQIILELQPKLSLAPYLLFAKYLHIVFILIICVLYTLMRGQSETFFGLMSDFRMSQLFQNYGLLIMVIVGLILFGLVWCAFAVSKTWYIFTNQRCILYSNFFFLRKIVIPYDKITDLNITQNPIQKFLNIVNVRIDTQGSFSTPASFFNINAVAGLSEEHAEKALNLMSSYSVKVR